MGSTDPSVLYPNAVYGSQGFGVYQDAAPTTLPAGEDWEAIPYRRTPPFGEPALNGEPEELPYPHDPPIDQAAEEGLLHDQMHGSGWRGYHIQQWVNPSNPGIPSLGPVNDQPYVSGHSQITTPNPSAEQGWGLDPAILLPRFPHSENVNPFYALGTHRRNGQLEFSNTGIPVESVSQQRVQLLTRAARQRSGSHVRLVDNPGMVPFSATVQPAGAAQPVAMNVLAPEDDGLY